MIDKTINRPCNMSNHRSAESIGTNKQVSENIWSMDQALEPEKTPDPSVIVSSI